MSIAVLAIGLAMVTGDPAMEALRRGFETPPAAFDTVPFWVWNDEMTERHIDTAISEFVARGIRSLIVHPRPGLMTPYLGDRWFDLFARTLEEAGRRGMELWIYDENSYPSGFAGGYVPEAMPESKAVNLVATESKLPPALTADTVAVFRLDGTAAVDVTDALRAGSVAGEGRYLAVARRTAGEGSAWHGGWWYVNLLRPGVTEKFLEITLEPYRSRFGAQFGRVLRGVFTDEPHIAGAGGLPWAPDFAEQFRERRGYDLRPHLASMFMDVGDAPRIRHDYFRTAHELFVERWAQPYHEYCRRHGLEMTGHYWEHGWPAARQVPDSMAMYLWMQRPGVDILFNQYAETPNAQFGNIRSVRELHSAALQAGRPRTLCEAYGGSGWDVRFEDLRRIGDWLLALGVNTINQHLAHASFRGARKRDYPVSFSAHVSWWPLYERSARYFARMQFALSQGEAAPAAVLVLEPTTTCWMYQDGVKPGRRAVEIANEFTALLGRLEAAQVEYELGSEDLIARLGAIDSGAFRVGRRRYPAVLLPPSMENLQSSTLRRLCDFAEAGGRVFACGAAPTRVDGALSDAPARRLAASPAWRTLTPESAPAALEEFRSPGAVIERAAGDGGLLFHMRRRWPDGELLFLVNTSSNEWSRGRVRSPWAGAEDWDAFTGRRQPAAAARDGDALLIPFELPPSTSRLVWLGAGAPPPVAPAAPAARRPVAAAGPIEVRRLDPATLTLDFVDVECGGETRSNLHVVAAADWVFSKHGFAKNPWRHAVQFRDRIMATQFAPDSGFVATYRFVIDGPPPAQLEVAVESPERYRLLCNGREVSARPGQHWLDPSVGLVDLSAVTRSGENELRLIARPMTVWHEIEHVILRGEFTL